MIRPKLPPKPKPGASQTEIAAYYHELSTARLQAAIQRKGVTKRGRAKLLVAQNGCCALCENAIPPDSQACYDKKQSKVLCRRCMSALVSIRSLAGDGVTWDIVNEYGG